MVRYRYTGVELPYTAQTSGGAVADISNTGVTVITATGEANRYVLQAPVAGARKTIIFSQGGTTGRTIELSSVSSSDAVTLLPATGGAGSVTEIVIDTTNIATIELLGVSTAQWKLLYQTSGQPAALSTGFVYQAS